MAWANPEHRRLNASPQSISILGAGAIGCFLGAHWAPALRAAGAKITLIGRKETWNRMGTGSLSLTGGDPLETQLSLLDLANSPEALSTSDVIVLTMKSTGLDQAIEEIRDHAPEGTPIITLLNGVSATQHLRHSLPNHRIIPGMVPFNVVWRSNRHLHRSSPGQVTVERCAITESLARTLAATGAPIAVQDDLLPHQYGKLLLNLINPINALSGLPLHAMLCDRGYRRIYSAALREALAVYAAAGVRWRRVGPISPHLVHRLLLLPNALFNTTLLKIQKLDRNSMTSMAVDLAAGRATEIDTITGEILKLAQSSGCSAPVNAALYDMIKAAEAGPGPAQGFSAETLLRDLRL